MFGVKRHRGLIENVRGRRVCVMDICELTNFVSKTFLLPFSLASLSHYSTHFFATSPASWLIRSYYVLFGASSYLSSHSIRGSRRCDIYFASCSCFLSKRGREKSAHSSTSPSADGDHKVSSAEMHVKRF